MTTKHTPGPWAVTRVGSCRAIHPAASTNERDDICRIVPHNYHPDGIDAADAEADATAALIVAAPDLLDALRLIASDPIPAEGFPMTPAGAKDYMVSIARAAIAKATGSAA